MSGGRTSHVIEFVGGGPENGVNGLYQDELMRLGDVLNGGSPTLLAWWRAAPVRVLELWYWTDRDRWTIRTRRSGDKMMAQFERPANMTWCADPRALARADVCATLGRVAEKLNLSAPPTTWM
jgi:hypothetical protein